MIFPVETLLKKKGEIPPANAGVSWFRDNGRILFMQILTYYMRQLSKSSTDFQ